MPNVGVKPSGIDIMIQPSMMSRNIPGYGYRSRYAADHQRLMAMRNGKTNLQRYRENPIMKYDYPPNVYDKNGKSIFFKPVEV